MQSPLPSFGPRSAPRGMSIRRAKERRPRKVTLTEVHAACGPWVLAKTPALDSSSHHPRLLWLLQSSYMFHGQILKSKSTRLRRLCVSESVKNQNTKLQFEAPGRRLPPLKPARPGRGPAFPRARGALPLSPQGPRPPPPRPSPRPRGERGGVTLSPAPPQPPRATGGAPQTRVLGAGHPRAPRGPGVAETAGSGPTPPRPRFEAPAPTCPGPRRRPRGRAARLPSSPQRRR